MAWPCDSRQLEEPGLTHFSNQVHVAQFKGTFTMFKVRLPKFATDIIVSISGPISRTLDLKGSAESPGIWL